MKFVRPLLISLGVITVIIATGVALVLVPSIQRRVVLHAAAGRPGLKFEVAAVAIGFSSLTVSGLKAEQRGLTVQIGRLEMDYSLWSLLFGHRLAVRRLVAGGMRVDASRVSPSKAGAAVAGAPAAIPGLLGGIILPFQLVLENCQISAQVLLPGMAGQPPLEAGCEIRGGGFAPGAEGSLRLIATVKNPAADASVGTLHAQVGLRATETAQRGFSRINLIAVVDAEGRSLSEQNQLKIAAELGNGLSGENYSVTVDTLIHGVAENLLALRAALSTGQNEYAGQWTLKARNAQLEPFFLGIALPDFDARGEGRVVYSPTGRSLVLQGSLEAGASRLEVINPVWRAIGAVKLNAQFDITASGNVARLRQLNVRLAGEKPVLEFSASQAAEVDFTENRLRIGGVADGEALNLKLYGLPLAWVAPFVPGVHVSGGAITGQFSITGGTDRLLLRSVQPLRIDQLTLARSGEPLLSKAAVSVALAAVLTDHELQATVSEFNLQTPLGDSFKAQGSVSIPVSPNPPVTVQANYTADLPALLAPWLPRGQIRAAGATDFTFSGGKIAFRSASTELSGPKDLFLGKVVTLRPFTFDSATGRVIGEKLPVDLVRIILGRLPLDWLPLNLPEATLAGTVEPGECVLKVDGEKLSLRMAAPWRMTGVALSQNGEPALTGLTVEASPSLELSGGSAAAAQTGEMSVRDAAGVLLLTCKGDAVRSAADGLRTSLSFALEIPAFASQPWFDGTQTVSEGRASGEIRATLGAVRQVEARLTVNGLVARAGGQLLPVANLSFRAVVQENGKISVQAPLLLDRGGQRSDLNFSLDVTPSGRNFTVAGKLTGDHVELADAAAVLGVFSVRAARKTPGPVSGESRAKIAADPVSAWSRFNGQLLLDLKSATTGKDWSMTGLTGVVAIDPAHLSLQKMEAAFGENSRLSATAALQFSAGAQPYELTGDFSLTEFDAGRFFKAVEPAKPPAIEGLFTVAGHFSGTGETVERTIDRTHGRFDLTSRQGVFRGLQRTTGKVSMTSKAVELGASMLGSLIGSEKATKAAEKVAGQAYFLDQLAQSIGEFKYDQLSVRLVRDETLNVTLEDVSLISPEIRLLGKGAIVYVPGKSMLDQPLTVALSFAGRGKIEQLLGKLRLLDGTRDEVGYARTREVITLAGSLARPDPTAFFTKIATAKFSDLLDSD